MSYDVNDDEMVTPLSTMKNPIATIEAYLFYTRTKKSVSAFVVRL